MAPGSLLAEPLAAPHAMGYINSKRRGARVVDRGGLENRCAFTGTVGSNPTLSASQSVAGQGIAGFGVPANEATTPA